MSTFKTFYAGTTSMIILLVGAAIFMTGVAGL